MKRLCRSGHSRIFCKGEFILLCKLEFASLKILTEHH